MLLMPVGGREGTSNDPSFDFPNCSRDRNLKKFLLEVADSSSYHSLTITMKPYHSLSYYIGKHNPYLNEFLIPYTETIYIGKTW